MATFWHCLKHLLHICCSFNSSYNDPIYSICSSSCSREADLPSTIEANKKRKLYSNNFIECVIRLEISYHSIQDVVLNDRYDLFRYLGIDLIQIYETASDTRDALPHATYDSRYAITVQQIAKNSKAQLFSLQIGAFLAQVQDIHLKSLSPPEVFEIIQQKLFEFKQEKSGSFQLKFLQQQPNPLLQEDSYAMTQFPSPQGTPLPYTPYFDISESEPEPKSHFYSEEASSFISQNSNILPYENLRLRSCKSMRHYWMSDRSVKACYECEKLFTFIRRRHHCRSCGQIFCSECCARLQPSLAIMNDTIWRLKKQLVCHTCRRQFKEGLQLNIRETSSSLYSLKRQNRNSKLDLKHFENSPISQSIVPISLRSEANDAREQAEVEEGEFQGNSEQQKARNSVLFSMFAKVHIVANVQLMTHQPKYRYTKISYRQKTRSPSLTTEIPGKLLISKLKRYNSDFFHQNPSHHRCSEAEFKRLVDESNREALLAGSMTLSYRHSQISRPRLWSGTFDEGYFGQTFQKNPFNASEETWSSFETSRTHATISSNAKEISILNSVGLAKDAQLCSIQADHFPIRDMAQHARQRLEEKIIDLFYASPIVSKLSVLDQHRWMQILYGFAHRAAKSILCEPDKGDQMDVMEYIQIKHISGGLVHESFFIDGVLVPKSLARKGMRNSIDQPRILLIASSLEYQRKRDAISSLESVANQEIEYMHLITEKIMTFCPDLVLFGGRVHRVAEELLFKENVVVIKNVPLTDLQRVARHTNASLLASCDHVDKMTEQNVLGSCLRFHVMTTDQESNRARNRLSLSYYEREKRPQRQNVVFDCGSCAKGCTLCLRGGPSYVLQEMERLLSIIIRSAYNMRLQRAMLALNGFVPLFSNAQSRSFAEEWFVKSSTSLYVSLKSNSLSMRAALKESQSMCRMCKEQTKYNNISSLRAIKRQSSAQSLDSWTILKRYIESGKERGCECKSSSLSHLRTRLVFSTCWSSLDGKTASPAQVMSIDFYSCNDLSLGQFLCKFCFSPENREFQRAFRTLKLSISHDTGRVTICVKDLSEKQTSYESLLMIKSERSLFWARQIGNSMTLATKYAKVTEDVWNYSFGKFLEDLFYGKTMQIDTQRFPHLAHLCGSRDPSLVRYFSRNGRVVSVQFEPVEPILHVAVQPMLWEHHIEYKNQIAAIKSLCDLAHQVYMITTEKVEESLADIVPPPHAKNNLRILRNEVRQWYSCYALRMESHPPMDIFEKNAQIKMIYEHAAEWSLRVRQATHATVKLSLRHAEHSPKSTLPRAWFNPIATMDKDEHASSLEEELMEPMMENAGDLCNLASIARDLAMKRKIATNTNSFNSISNEVANTLNTHFQNGMSRHFGDLRGHSFGDSQSHEEEHGMQTLPAQENSWGSFSQSQNIGGAALTCYSTQMALEAFRKSRQNCEAFGLGYLKIPKCILENHPSLPCGVNGTVILVNASQPTSVVAYSLCSKQFTAELCAYIQKENISQKQIRTAQLAQYHEKEMLKVLQSQNKNNIDHVFVDENEFQPATRFSCKSYYAMQFHALRRLYYGGDRNYIESLCHCEQWNAAGGKSGAGFLKTLDQRFIAKAIPHIEVQMFLSMATDYFHYMAKTFQNNLTSMLSKVLGIYKVTISNETDQTMCILVMENLLYGRDINFSFDLKGKMEGRYRSSPENTRKSVLWDRNFVEMAGGIPLPLQESAMSLLRSAVMNDTAFLSSVQATDYSMLVGYDTGKQEIVACIIDYIHKYDFMKMVEHAGKRLIQEEDEITVLNPKHYRKRFCQAMQKYFTTIPSRYTKITF